MLQKQLLSIYMKRIEFIKKSGLGLLSVRFLASCKSTIIDADDSNNISNTQTNNSCSSTPSETEGPFPTKIPANFKIIDIRSDRPGVLLNMEISILNKTKGCSGLEGAYVDVWHCDKDGNYSEYGGTGMQTSNFTAVHFLRGRQQTDSMGLVKFKTIFPGWYPGRAPHIHVHVFTASGKSLLITQIAFPKVICDTVYTKATNLYTKGSNYTANEKDNVFSDGVNLQMPEIIGNISNGFTLKHNIVVNG